MMCDKSFSVLLLSISFLLLFLANDFCFGVQGFLFRFVLGLLFLKFPRLCGEGADLLLKLICG